MPLLKRTYALPAETVQRFEQQVEPGQRSVVITEILRKWLNNQPLDHQRREQLRQDIIEGCRDMADVDLEIARKRF